MVFFICVNYLSLKNMFILSILTSPTVTGTLKGYDQLMNLVLDDVKESMRGNNPLSKLQLVEYCTDLLR